jgi:hypothetical protein
MFSTTRLVKTSGLLFKDVTWDHATMSLWCSTESDLGILSACIPTFGTLLPGKWNDAPTGSSVSYTANRTSRWSYDSTLAMMKVPKADEISLGSGSHLSSRVRDEELGTVGREHMDIMRTTEFIIGREGDRSTFNVAARS